jgi:hypothetical protein
MPARESIDDWVLGTVPKASLPKRFSAPRASLLPATATASGAVGSTTTARASLTLIDSARMISNRGGVQTQKQAMHTVSVERSSRFARPPLRSRATRRPGWIRACLARHVHAAPPCVPCRPVPVCVPDRSPRAAEGDAEKQKKLLLLRVCPAPETTDERFLFCPSPSPSPSPSAAA